MFFQVTDLISSRSVNIQTGQWRHLATSQCFCATFPWSVGNIMSFSHRATAPLGSQSPCQCWLFTLVSGTPFILHSGLRTAAQDPGSAVGELHPASCCTHQHTLHVPTHSSTQLSGMITQLREEDFWKINKFHFASAHKPLYIHQQLFPVLIFSTSWINIILNKRSELETEVY